MHYLNENDVFFLSFNVSFFELKAKMQNNVV
jgi:hypothetical protein